MSWLSDRLGVHVNLRPYAAAAGGILGGMVSGPLGAGLGAGLFKTADNKAHGDSWQHALGQGALNGGLAYGAGSLFGGGTSSAPTAADFAKSGGVGIGSPIQNGVMSRVMGAGGVGLGSQMTAAPGGQGVMNSLGNVASGAGNFIKNNHQAIETAGNAAGGILNAHAASAAANVADKSADTQRMQVQAALDKEKRVQDAYAAMFGQPLAGAHPPAVVPGPSSHSMAAPMTPRFKVADGEGGGGPGDMGGGGTGDTGGGGKIDQGGDTTKPGISSGPPGPKPAAPSDTNDALNALLKRLGYAPPPTSPYAGNESAYGSPYGGGYTSQSYFQGGGY